MADPIPTAPIPMSDIIIEAKALLWIAGINMMPIWMEAAMTTMFAIVPNPGLSPSGIHVKRRNELITKVARPIDIAACLDSPSAKTVQGEFPILD